MLEPGLAAVILAISVVNWAGFARIVRAQVTFAQAAGFVEAARALGVPAWKIIARHLFPNMLGTMLVMASYYIAITVIAEAGLALHRTRRAAADAESRPDGLRGPRFPRTSSPGSVILPGIDNRPASCSALNTLGDGLRDIFDPRLRRW